MTLLTPLLHSLARAGAVAFAVLGVLLVAGPGVLAWPRRARAFVFWVGAGALLVPGFAIGFILFAGAMKRGVIERETLYCALVLMRYGLLAILAAWMMPSSLSPEALHCLRQSGASWLRIRIWELRAWGRGLWLGIALVFLLAFQEFEISTTWNMRAWTVALFDAQAGGLALSESLRLALLPLLVQAVLIAFLAVRLRASSPAMERSGVMTDRSAVAMTLGAGMMFAFLVPAFTIGGGAYAVFLFRGDIVDLAPWREILNSTGIAFLATSLAWLVAGKVRGFWWLLALPGLCGPLITALLLLSAMQLPPLHLLRGTLFPAVVGLALSLLPFALLLRHGIDTTRDSTALFTARASRSARAVWQLDGFPRLVSLLLLFVFACGDFTINSLLAPPQFTSSAVRLLNLLHYGQSAALGAMFIISFAVPFALAILTAILARLYARRRRH